MEIISSARLDNLVGTYTSVQALIDSCQDANSVGKDEMIRVTACYDNEEVCGNNSRHIKGIFCSVVAILCRALVVPLPSGSCVASAAR